MSIFVFTDEWPSQAPDCHQFCWFPIRVCLFETRPQHREFTVMPMLYVFWRTVKLSPNCFACMNVIRISWAVAANHWWLASKPKVRRVPRGWKWMIWLRVTLGIYMKINEDELAQIDCAGLWCGLGELRLSGSDDMYTHSTHRWWIWTPKQPSNIELPALTLPMIPLASTSKEPESKPCTKNMP